MEFALILPVFLMLVFGIVQYGTIFLLRNQMIEAASDAGRTAATSSTMPEAITTAENALVGDVVRDSGGLISSSVGCNTAAMSCTAVQDTSDCNVPTGYECLKVVVTYNYGSHPVLALPFLPAPSTITASSTVVIGNGALTQ